MNPRKQKLIKEIQAKIKEQEEMIENIKFTIYGMEKTIKELKR